MTGLPAALHFLDDHLLGDRHLVDGDFYAEVASGDHDAIHSGDDLVDIADGFVLFDFSDDADFGAACLADAAQNGHIAGGANEGGGDPIHFLGDAEAEIFEVFVGDRSDGERDAGGVDAFVAAERAADDDLADQLAGLAGADF